jgi:hypothetical protein
MSSPANSGAGGAGATNLASGITLSSYTSNGGAGGGGVSSGDAVGNGGPISTSASTAIAISNPDYVRNQTLIAGGVGDNATTRSPHRYTLFTKYSPGVGGVGGGGGSLTTANNGQDGYRGGGGGGGGGARNGITTGNGGKGGDGYVVIAAFG